MNNNTAPNVFNDDALAYLISSYGILYTLNQQGQLQYNLDYSFERKQEILLNLGQCLITKWIGL